MAALTDALRDEAENLQLARQRLLVDRERLQAELAECDQGGRDAERIRQSCSRFAELFPQLSHDQQRDLITLFLVRVEVRPTKPSTNQPPGTRNLELRLKLRIERLLDGMEERLVVE